jgi:hypothetical protein
MPSQINPSKTRARDFFLNSVFRVRAVVEQRSLARRTQPVDSQTAAVPLTATIQASADRRVE